MKGDSNMKYATKKSAKEVIEKEKERKMTAYFDGEISMSEMHYMLRNRMQFGEAETNVILASMVLAGAKFKI